MILILLLLTFNRKRWEKTMWLHIAPGATFWTCWNNFMELFESYYLNWIICMERNKGDQNKCVAFQWPKNIHSWSLSYLKLKQRYVRIHIQSLIRYSFHIKKEWNSFKKTKYDKKAKHVSYVTQKKQPFEGEVKEVLPFLFCSVQQAVLTWN